MSNSQLQQAPLGKKSAYINQYDASLLFPIARQTKRDEINVPATLPFFGYDTWNAYEVSWLNPKGKPQVAIAQFDIGCDSLNIIESKSFKLYLNSFNHSKFNSFKDVAAILKNDITQAAQGDVKLKLHTLSDFHHQSLANFEGECIDDLDISCNEYQTNKQHLTVNENTIVTEHLHSHLLKSNCLVTGQPDWGSVEIQYHGPKIDRAGLLKYIISFRNHNEFHEQCVERIFMDIQSQCQPIELMVNARYTRRGGLDINPARCSKNIPPQQNIRLARQ